MYLITRRDKYLKILLTSPPTDYSFTCHAPALFSSVIIVIMQGKIRRRAKKDHGRRMHPVANSSIAEPPDQPITAASDSLATRLIWAASPFTSVIRCVYNFEVIIAYRAFEQCRTTMLCVWITRVDHSYQVLLHPCNKIHYDLLPQHYCLKASNIFVVPVPISLKYEYLTEAFFYLSQGYYLNANPRRVCNGTWSGVEPACLPVKCSPPMDHDVNVTFEFTGLSVGSKLTYNCPKGFALIGDRTRSCQIDGTWDSKPPTCISKSSSLIWTTFPQYIPCCTTSLIHVVIKSFFIISSRHVPTSSADRESPTVPRQLVHLVWKHPGIPLQPRLRITRATDTDLYRVKNMDSESTAHVRCQTERAVDV